MKKPRSSASFAGPQLGWRKLLILWVGIMIGVGQDLSAQAELTASTVLLRAEWEKRQLAKSPWRAGRDLSARLVLATMDRASAQRYAEDLCRNKSWRRRLDGVALVAALFAQPEDLLIKKLKLDRDPNWTVRREVFRKVSAKVDPSLLENWKANLRHDNWQVRRAAWRSLRRQEQGVPASFVESLTAGIDDLEPEVREEAAWAGLRTKALDPKNLIVVLSAESFSLELKRAVWLKLDDFIAEDLTSKNHFLPLQEADGDFAASLQLSQLLQRKRFSWHESFPKANELINRGQLGSAIEERLYRLLIYYPQLDRELVAALATTELKGFAQLVLEQRNSNWPWEGLYRQALKELAGRQTLLACLVGEAAKIDFEITGDGLVRVVRSKEAPLRLRQQALRIYLRSAPKISAELLNDCLYNLDSELAISACRFLWERGDRDDQERCSALFSLGRSKKRPAFFYDTMASIIATLPRPQIVGIYPRIIMDQEVFANSKRHAISALFKLQNEEDLNWAMKYFAEKAEGRLKHLIHLEFVRRSHPLAIELALAAAKEGQAADFSALQLLMSIPLGQEATDAAIVEILKQRLLAFQYDEKSLSILLDELRRRADPGVYLGLAKTVLGNIRQARGPSIGDEVLSFLATEHAEADPELLAEFIDLCRENLGRQALMEAVIERFEALEQGSFTARQELQFAEIAKILEQRWSKLPAPERMSAEETQSMATFVRINPQVALGKLTELCQSSMQKFWTPKTSTWEQERLAVFLGQSVEAMTRFAGKAGLRQAIALIFEARRQHLLFQWQNGADQAGDERFQSGSDLAASLMSAVRFGADIKALGECLEVAFQELSPFDQALMGSGFCAQWLRVALGFQTDRDPLVVLCRRLKADWTWMDLMSPRELRTLAQRLSHNRNGDAQQAKLAASLWQMSDRLQFSARTPGDQNRPWMRGQRRWMREFWLRRLAFVEAGVGPKFLSQEAVTKNPDIEGLILCLDRHLYRGDRVRAQALIRDAMVYFSRRSELQLRRIRFFLDGKDFESALKLSRHCLTSAERSGPSGSLGFAAPFRYLQAAALWGLNKESGALELLKAAKSDNGFDSRIARDYDFSR